MRRKTYLISIAVTIALAAISLFFNEPVIKDQEIGNMLYSASILATLSAVVLSLKYGQKQKLAAEKENDENIQKEIIEKSERIKLWAISSVVYLDEALYIFTKNINLLYCAAIAFIVVVFFCYPKED